MMTWNPQHPPPSQGRPSEQPKTVAQHLAERIAKLENENEQLRLRFTIAFTASIAVALVALVVAIWLGSWSSSDRDRTRSETLEAVHTVQGQLSGLTDTIQTASKNYSSEIGRLNNEMANLKQEMETVSKNAESAIQQAIKPEPAGKDAGTRQASSPTTADVKLSIEPIVLGDRRVVVKGQTNLPGGTSLMVTVEEELPGGFSAQARCTVEPDGDFETVAIGPSGGLKHGRYSAQVLMPIPRVQSEDVQRVIGTKGENLRGPLVRHGALGVTVEAEATLIVGDADAELTQRRRAADALKTYDNSYGKLNSLYRQLESNRKRGWLDDPNDLESLAKWGKFARDFTEQVDSLRERLDGATPASPRFYLSVAAGDLAVMLVDAAHNNPGYGDQEELFKESMAEARKKLQELRRFLRNE